MELLFAKRIRGKRLEKGLTQEQLAQASRIPRYYPAPEDRELLSDLGG